ncbi:MAG: exodeoxyribonuclease VII large subunit [Planctomycetota bacterium]|nr:exodeoxyribonuclease VII large subunit [Planctomycetota bacterium]
MSGPAAVKKVEASKPERAFFTVTEAALKVRQVVEDAFPPLWILGEVSSFRQPRSGHIYFSLKDGRSLLHVVMFRGSFGSGLPVPLKDGMEVLVLGRLSTYERGSEVQVIAQQIEPHGQGALELQREALEKKFAKAGLFAQSRKKPLPRFPRRIGIVSSPTGAAIRDILTTLDRQWPLLNIVIAPARVQGVGSAEQVGEGIDALNALQPPPDVIIVSRGGGSVEHLWGFNLEPIVLAIARSEVPVITGVGHEVDETLADLVADVRAATPTAAAKVAVPELAELEKYLGESERRLKLALRRQLDHARQRLDEIQERYDFRSIRSLLKRQRQGLDELSSRFDRSVRQRLRFEFERLSALEKSYAFRVVPGQMRENRRLLESLGEGLDRSISGRLQEGRGQLKHLSLERLQSAMVRQLQKGQEKMAQTAAKLEAMSPLKVLARGYGIVLKEGSVVKDATDLVEGDVLDIRLSRGQVRARVEDSSEIRGKEGVE